MIRNVHRAAKRPRIVHGDRPETTREAAEKTNVLPVSEACTWNDEHGRASSPPGIEKRTLKEEADFWAA